MPEQSFLVSWSVCSVQVSFSSVSNTEVFSSVLALDSLRWFICVPVFCYKINLDSFALINGHLVVRTVLLGSVYFCFSLSEEYFYCIVY